MPGGDRTGPFGWGPMTGRAAGYCAGFPAPGSWNPMPGLGYGGWGRGRGGRGGRGRRNWYYATGLTGWQRAGLGWPGLAEPAYPTSYVRPFAPYLTREQELDGLKGRAEYFEDALAGIRQRIEALEAKGTRQD
ncbi:MAG: DUF5320 domain-containing protein [bacterium]